MSTARGPAGPAPLGTDPPAAAPAAPAGAQPTSQRAMPADHPPADHPPADEAALLRLRASRLRLSLALAALRTDAEPDRAAGDRQGQPWTARPDGHAFDRASDRAGGADGFRRPGGAPLLNGLLDDVLDAITRGGHAPLAWLAWRLGRTLGRDRLASWSTRHPWRLVGAAALGTAVLVGVRPWRWLTRPAVMAGLLVQLVSVVRKRRASPAEPDSPASPVNPPPAGRWRRTTGQRPGVFR